MCATSAGASFDATLMSPCAPMPMAAKRQVVVAGKNLETARQRVHQLGNLRQLAAGLFDGLDVRRGRGQPHNRFGIEVHCRAPRHVVDDHRQRIAPLWPAPENAGTGPPARACCNRDSPRARRSGRECGAAARPGAPARAWSCACSRPTPERGPPRPPPPCAPSCSHSSSSSVAASPVEPQATRKSIPDSICQFTSAHSAGSSIEPSARKGVTIAVPQPVVSIIQKSLYRLKWCPRVPAISEGPEPETLRLPPPNGSTFGAPFSRG